MIAKTLLVICLVAVLVQITLGESAIDKLKAKIESGTAAKPCDKAVPTTAPPPRQFLDHRLPVVVDDYHHPVGGFNPTHIPNHEVDRAARKILREIQEYHKEQREMGAMPATPETNGIMTTEEHKALKQLLLDADILVRHAAKSLTENGPIDPATIAKSAIVNAAQLEKNLAAANMNIGATYPGQLPQSVVPPVNGLNNRRHDQMRQNRAGHRK